MKFDLGSLQEMLHVSFKPRVPRDVVVGVDFGGGALKVVQVSRKRGIPVLDTYGTVPLGHYFNIPDGVGVKLNRELFTTALKDLVRDAGVTAEGAVVTLPYGATFTAVFEVPTLVDSEITEQLPNMIRGLIPVQLRDVTIDWYPFARNMQEKKTVVIAVAVYNNTLQQLRGVVTDAGFTVLATELEYFSAMRAAEMTDGGTGIVIDLGTASGKVYFVQGGHLAGVFGVTSLGGEHLTRAIEREKGISFEEAERMKYHMPLRGMISIQKIVEKSVQEIISHLGSHIYRESLGRARVVVIGGGARFPDIAESIKEKLSQQVVRGEPMRLVAIPGFLEDLLMKDGGIYAVSLAAALSIVNEDR